MQNSFNTYCKQIGLADTSKILLAVSGGLDSMALLHLLYASKMDVEVAHCNFQLRGAESDGDEDLVKMICKDLNIPCHINTFSTESYADEKGLSIQMAARDLRYAWFEKLRKERACDYIATAHHQDDQVETLLLNLLRGTGLKGLHGILPMNHKIVRPLLFCSRIDLEDWVAFVGINYREDSSNASTKYSRNKLRHDIIPLLKELNPSLAKTMQENTERFEGAQKILHYFLEKDTSKLLIDLGAQKRLSIQRLAEYPSPITILFHLMSPFGFKDWKAMETLLSSESGKQISSETHLLLKDRDYLLLKEYSVTEDQVIEIQKEQTKVEHPIVLKLSILDATDFEGFGSLSEAALDFDKLQFPLQLRKWREGDRFQPLGMKGQKKLSDYFIDEKFSVFDKKNAWLLCSVNDIVWLVGHRIHEAYKLGENTQKVYLVQLK